MKKKSTKYKMRAECAADLGRFVTEISVDTVSAKRISGLPDMEIEFDSTHSLEFIRVKLSLIVDAHVMLETVALATEYTGERIQL